MVYFVIIRVDKQQHERMMSEYDTNYILENALMRRQLHRDHFLVRSQ